MESALVAFVFGPSSNESDGVAWKGSCREDDFECVCGVRDVFCQHIQNNVLKRQPIIGCGDSLLLVYCCIRDADSAALSTIRATPATRWQPLGVRSGGNGDNLQGLRH